MSCAPSELIAAASALEGVALFLLDNPCCCVLPPAFFVLLVLAKVMALVAEKDKQIFGCLYSLAWLPLLPAYYAVLFACWFLRVDSTPAVAAPPSREDVAAAARARYAAAVTMLESAGLDAIELRAGLTKAKQQLLRDLNDMMQ